MPRRFQRTARGEAKPPDKVVSDWTFLTDHAHVLVLLAREPRSTVAELARALDLEAPTVEAILKDLETRVPQLMGIRA